MDGVCSRMRISPGLPGLEAQPALSALIRRSITCKSVEPDRCKLSPSRLPRFSWRRASRGDIPLTALRPAVLLHGQSAMHTWFGPGLRGSSWAWRRDAAKPRGSTPRFEPSSRIGSDPSGSSIVSSPFRSSICDPRGMSAAPCVTAVIARAYFSKPTAPLAATSRVAVRARGDSVD
jgi:hypothetical protein